MTKVILQVPAFRTKSEVILAYSIAYPFKKRIKREKIPFETMKRHV